jgi:predicted DNA-binding protein
MIRIIFRSIKPSMEGMRMKPRITFFIDQEMMDKLKTLSRITRVKQADYIREGIAYVLEKYREEFKRVLKGGSRI